MILIQQDLEVTHALKGAPGDKSKLNHRGT